MANQPGGGPFDLPKFFNPSIPSSSSSVQPLTSTNFPNPSSNTAANPNLISPLQAFPLPSASYPPPTGGAPGGGPYPFQHPTSSSSPFHHNPPPQFIHPFQHQQFINNSGNPPPSALSSHDTPPPSQFSNHLHPYTQRSMSFPTPPLQPPMTTGPHPGQFPNPQNLSNGNNANNNSNQTPGARLMAMLSGSPSTLEMSQQTGFPLTPIQPTLSGGSDLSVPHTLPTMVPASHSLPVMVPVPHVGFPSPGPTRMLSSNKLPKGRHLVGAHAVYDIDARLPGEVQPQLEVTPITKYGSDPGLVLGRQIAVNKTYICYGLKQGAVRVLNINTALRSLFKGLAQRVTDMAFFAEDVHLLASASVDGRVYVWKIAEDQDEEDKPQITGKIVIAVQFNTEGQSVHPRICWHCHKQEVLVVGIGRHVLKIDTTKVGKGEVYSAEEPLRCPIDRLIDGIQLVGSHDGEITDLSMCQWMTTRLVSASIDGTVKIWEDRKTLPIAILRPHDGQPVNSVTFLTASHRPDHIILITGGPLNREIKIWVSASEEGWLLPSDSESWRNIQALELKSSAESHVEEAFFNQVVALPQAGLLLLANAKKNAIYAVHLDFGSYPASSRMDYVAEFTVTMPILSFTGTSDFLPHGEQIVQVYCVQTQAIQQYALDLSQCLPPPIENPLLDKSDWDVSRDAMNSDVPAASEPSETKATEIPVSVSAQASKVPVRDSGIETAAPARQMASSFAESLTSHEFPAPTVESKALPLPAVVGNNDLASIASPSLPSSPRLSGNLSGLPSKSLEPGPSFSDTIGDSKVIGYSVDRQMDSVPAISSDVGSTNHESRNDEDKVLPSDISANPDHHVQFTHPTHLVTPSEILMANSSSEVTHVDEHACDSEVNIQDVVTVDDPQDVEVGVKVVGETRYSQYSRIGSHEDLHTFGAETKEKTFYSQASDLGMQMVRECQALSPDNYIVEESRQVEGVSRSESLAQPSASEEDAHDTTKDVSGNVDSYTQLQLPHAPTPCTKGKKQTGKDTLGPVPFSPSPNAFNSTDSTNDVGAGLSIPSLEAAFSQIMGMQETLNELVNMQKEMQKQMNMLVAVPVTKEGRRLEAALGKSIEKSVRANNDALWARFQEDNVKQEKSSKERNQQMASLINTCLNKDLPILVEKTVKKELASLGQAVARTIAPTIEKAVSSSITESFQKGVADKAVNQIEKSLNSKLESTVARQIQAQFQTSGKQALQESLKSNLESSVIPAFEMSCKAMFEQVDAAFQKGMSEHATAALKQFDATHSTLALALRDALNSASSVGQILSSELADGQRKLLALAVAGANSKVANPLVQQISNGSLGGLHEKPEVPLDPTKELARLISEKKYEEAFSAALQRSDVSIVSWLCSQVDLAGMLTKNPLPLSQGVLISLLQQLACDIGNESPKKMLWMRDVVTAINPSDPVIAVHVRPIFQQVYSILDHRRNIPTIGGPELSNIRLILHVINSMLMTCK